MKNIFRLLVAAVALVAFVGCENGTEEGGKNKENRLATPVLNCNVQQNTIIVTWESVDFENKIIYIRQKAVEVERDGKVTVAISDEMKNESSRRTLPLVPEVEEILLRHKEKQAERCKRFRKAYSKEWQDMVCVDSMGTLLRPNYITAHFPLLLEQNGLRKIRFHDLRHTCASLLLSKNVKKLPP